MYKLSQDTDLGGKENILLLLLLVFSAFGIVLATQ